MLLWRLGFLSLLGCVYMWGVHSSSALVDFFLLWRFTCLACVCASGCICVPVFPCLSIHFSLPPILSLFLYHSPPIICLSSSLLYNWSHINPNCIFYYELHTIYSLTCSIPNLKCKGTKCSMASSKSLSLLLPLAFDLINVFIFIKLDTDIILKIKHLKINPERKTIPPHYTLDLHLRFIFKSFGRSFWYIPPVLKQHAYVSFSWFCSVLGT